MSRVPRRLGRTEGGVGNAPVQDESSAPDVETMSGARDSPSSAGLGD